ncbi:radical SAM protein [Candidatus Daviesbacteria bacterium]|nr:radical SAM protein [Candidatus Daviesbacteria bacterium]
MEQTLEQPKQEQAPDIKIAYVTLQFVPDAPPLGLASMATYFREYGNFQNQKVIDVADKYRVSETLNYSPDIVFISANTMHYPKAIAFAKEIKSKQDVKILIGGVHISTFPQSLDPIFELGCIGEGEHTGLELMNIFRSKKKFTHDNLQNIQGLVYFNEGKLHMTAPRQLIKPLDSIPHPDRGFLRPSYFNKKTIIHTKTAKRLTGIITSRGCPYKCMFCLHPKQRIVTKDGFVKIADIVKDKKQTEVLTHEGRFRRVNNFLERDYKGNIIEIQPHKLGEKIVVTENHKLLVLRKDKLSYTHEGLRKMLVDFTPEWIEAKNIQKSDFILLPKFKDHKDRENIVLSEIFKDVQLTRNRFRDNTNDKEIMSLHREGWSGRSIGTELGLPKSTVFKIIGECRTGINKCFKYGLLKEDGMVRFPLSTNKVFDDIPLDNDTMRLFGYYLAEGHVTKQKGRYNTWVLGLTFNKKETNLVEDALHIFKKNFGIDVCVNSNKQNNTIQITVTSSILCMLFKKMFGDDCYSKHIPSEFLFLPDSKIKELINGWFLGDGCKSQGRVETSSRQLYEQMKFLYLRLGIQVTCFERDNGISPIYVIDLPKQKPLKSIYSFDHTNNLAFRVRSVIKKYYEGKVYNLSVDEDETYLAYPSVIMSNCSTAHFWKDFRINSAKHIAEEMEYLIKNYKIQSFFIYDDLFTVHKNRLKELVVIMKEKGLLGKFSINCMGRTDNIDEELLSILKQLNTDYINFGFESGSDRILQFLKNEQISVETHKKAIIMCEKYGIGVQGSLMFASPGETAEDMQKTLDLIDFMYKHNVNIVWSTITKPLPGTPLWDLAIKEGIITPDIDLRRLSEMNVDPIMKDKNLSREDFDRLFKAGRAKIRKLELRYWWRKLLADPLHVGWFVIQNFKFIRFFTLDRGEP